MQENSGNLSLVDEDDTNGCDYWAPLLTGPVRVLHAWEQVVDDFSKTESISCILRALPEAINKSVNDIEIETAIQAAQKFSSSAFAVAADPPAHREQARVDAVTVDVDSISATFTRRNRLSSTDSKRDLCEIFNKLEALFKDDPNFVDNTTSFNPNRTSFKKIPSGSKKSGPTINPYPKMDYYRIQLPAPMGSEVFKIWIFAPKKMKSFARLLHATSNMCALALVDKHNSIIKSALTSAVEKKIVGFRAFDIPGGYMFPICIALCFLEEHQDCSFTIETYNCKKKGFRFQASAKTFGEDAWSHDLAMKMRQFVDSHRGMLKVLCKLDRIAEIQPQLSKIGFGMEIQYKDTRNGNSLYSLCKPLSDLCDRSITYPLAFLPKEMASRLSFLKNGDRVQSYIPAWHQANWRRNKKYREVSNLGLRHCISKGHTGTLTMNVTDLLRGAKQEQIMIDDVLKQFRANFCERIEIATSWSFTKQNTAGSGLGCWNGQSRTGQGSSQDSRWLDLKGMIGQCVSYVNAHTHFWDIGPIADYISLNFAAALAIYHTSARNMADASLVLMEREQCCRTMVYVNQLLRMAKDGKLWQQKNQPKLSLLTRGAHHNRELMLPQVPGRVLTSLAQAAGMQLRHVPTVCPISPQKVVTIRKNFQMIADRLRENRMLQNNFGCRVLRCRTCGVCFYGGKGINDDLMYKHHLKENPDHATGPSNDDKMSNKHWYFDYKHREAKIMHRYQHMYNDEQRRAYDVVMKEQKSAVLLGIGGAGKSMIVQDLLDLLRCLFWKKGEVHVCGATHAVAQRMENTASTFHSFLGIQCDREESGAVRWDFTVDEYLDKIRNNKKHNLQSARIVVVDEGLEVPSNLMEAYFRHIEEAGLNIISIITGDVCQGVFREDQETGIKQKPFFADPIKHADLCQSVEIVTFTEDHRTKCASLRCVKEAVRNALADTQTEYYVQHHQYSGQTRVDIILCARISDMLRHNTGCLSANINQQMVYMATQAHTRSSGTEGSLQYKFHGVESVILLKIGAPIMIMQTYDTEGGKKLRNGTLGKISNLKKESVTIQIGQEQFEIKPVKIFGTNWTQLPICVAYAGTIAKCIGFEFDSVAIDFGVRTKEDGSALWRSKQAYTAISRAKQECYFIGSAPLSLLNNMDRDALSFFNSFCLSNQQRKKQMQVVRDVFEMSEFWVNQTRSNSRIRVRSETVETERQHIKKRSKCIQLDAMTIDHKQIQVFADVYPTCFQNMGASGQIFRATSKEFNRLLLKRKSESSEEDFQCEIKILNACSDIAGVLKIIATTATRGILLESMDTRVSWAHFAKKATSDAKNAFRLNMHKLLEDLNHKRIAHKNMSSRTAWVDINGTVKLTWFQDAEYPATAGSLAKDRTDAYQLIAAIFPEPANQFDISSAGTNGPLGENGDASCQSLEPSVLNEGNYSDHDFHEENYSSHDFPERYYSEVGYHRCDCSSECVMIAGNVNAKEKVDSAFKWLVDACLAMNLISSAVDTVATAHKTPEEVFLCWARDVKQSTESRHKTGGGITDADFWPNVVKKLKSQSLMTNSNVFVDFGSEYFLQGLLCALLGDFEEVVGIEIQADTYNKSVELARYLTNKAIQENKFMSTVELHFGDFLNHDAILGAVKRSSVVYANNVVFGSTINANLVQMWRQHLSAYATIVVFDDTAILSSGETRTSRTRDKLDWVSRIDTMSTQVSWRPGHTYDVQLWVVSPIYTSMRNWAVSAALEDLLGWAICNAKAFLLQGDQKSASWQDCIIIQSHISVTRDCWNTCKQAPSLFIVIKSSIQDYEKAQDQLIQNNPPELKNMCFVCIVDGSLQNPIVDSLLEKLSKLAEVPSS